MKTAIKSKTATPENIGGACMSGKPLAGAEERRVAEWVKARKASGKPKKKSAE